MAYDYYSRRLRSGIHRYGYVVRRFVTSIGECCSNVENVMLQHAIFTETAIRSLHSRKIFLPRNNKNVNHEPKRLSELMRREFDNATEDEKSDFLLKYLKVGKFEDVVSEIKWRALENATQEEQREFLLKYMEEGKFEDEPVRFEKKNVKLGDDLFYHGSVFGIKYEHHFLCIGIYSDGIGVIEYNGDSSGGLLLSLTKCKPLAQAKIQRGYKTFQELEKIKAKRRIWPKDLERFTVYEAISRALDRMEKEGRWFNLINNNCECFVNWCKCGLNISLQVVKPEYKFIVG